VEFVEIVREEIRVVAAKEARSWAFWRMRICLPAVLGIPESYLQLVRDVDDSGLLTSYRVTRGSARIAMALATGERPEPRPVVLASLVTDPLPIPMLSVGFWVPATRKPWRKRWRALGGVAGVSASVAASRG